MRGSIGLIFEMMFVNNGKSSFCFVYLIIRVMSVNYYGLIRVILGPGPIPAWSMGIFEPPQLLDHSFIDFDYKPSAPLSGRVAKVIRFHSVH